MLQVQKTNLLTLTTYFIIKIKFALGIAAEILFALRKKIAAQSPTRRGTPKISSKHKPK